MNSQFSFLFSSSLLLSCSFLILLLVCSFIRLSLFVSFPPFVSSQVPFSSVRLGVFLYVSMLHYLCVNSSVSLFLCLHFLWLCVHLFVCYSVCMFSVCIFIYLYGTQFVCVSICMLFCLCVHIFLLFFCESFPVFACSRFVCSSICMVLCLCV